MNSHLEAKREREREKKRVTTAASALLKRD